ncbi:hypothetical protein Z950_2899 [Sulfitobacter mediterraneus KCTC 32188]|nr:hypothetical protein Z950_2899 [Sulfitobacter mediterraneus KCTC 32188]
MRCVSCVLPRCRIKSLAHGILAGAKQCNLSTALFETL